MLEENPVSNGIMAAENQSHEFDLNSFAVIQIIEGISRGKSYAYALGAQKRDAVKAKDKSGSVGRERNLQVIRIARAINIIVKCRFAVPTQFSWNPRKFGSVVNFKPSVLCDPIWSRLIISKYQPGLMIVSSKSISAEKTRLIKTVRFPARQNANRVNTIRR